MKPNNLSTPPQTTHTDNLRTPALAESTTSSLTTTEAATYLNIKPATLEQWRWNGRGPKFCKIGRSCRYLTKELDRFLEERTYVSTTDAQSNRS